MSWLRLLHCLRATGLPIEGVKRYIQLCAKGESTIPERAAIIFVQERSLKQQIKAQNQQMKVLKYKKANYEKLVAGQENDRCNPAAKANVESAMTEK